MVRFSPAMCSYHGGRAWHGLWPLAMPLAGRNPSGPSSFPNELARLTTDLTWQRDCPSRSPLPKDGDSSADEEESSP